MDIHCVKCGEPLDLHELHDIPGMSFEQARAAYFADGCKAIGFTCNDTPNRSAASVSSALHDLLGDDVDGIAAMMDDARMEGYWA